MTVIVSALLGLLAGAFAPEIIRRLPDPPPGDLDAARERGDAAEPAPDLRHPPHVLYRDLAAQPGLRPAMALATGGVWALLGWARGSQADLPAFLLLGAVAVMLTYIDIRVHRLPDLLTLPTLAAGALLLLASAFVAGEWGAYLRGWLAALALFGGYLVLAMIRPSDLGFGDVKLAAVLGLYLGWLGWGTVVVGAFLGFLFGALAGIALLATRRATRRSAIPFGPYMLLGAIVATVWGDALLDIYLGR